MNTLCTLAIRQNADSAQLKALWELLTMWSDEALDDSLCFPQIDRSVMDDLEAGELPQPEYLWFTRLFHEMNEVFDMIGHPKIELGEFGFKQIKAELGKNNCRRTVSIIIEPLADWGSDEVSDAICQLQSRLTCEIVESFDVVTLPDEPEESYEPDELGDE